MAGDDQTHSAFCKLGVERFEIRCAGTIFGYGSPIDAIPGGSVIDFTSAALGSHINTTIGDVEFTSNTAFDITDANAGSFNTTGRHIDAPAGWLFQFDFATPVDAFAFNFGAHDFQWTLRGYGVADNLLETLVIAGIGGGSLGEYYGLSGGGYSYARLTAADPNDYILLDNFTYRVAAIPLPASLPLFLSGLVGLGLAARRRKKT